MGNVARGLVPRSRQSGNKPYSRATGKKTRQPPPRFSYLGAPAPAGISDWHEHHRRGDSRIALGGVAGEPHRPRRERNRCYDNSTNASTMRHGWGKCGAAEGYARRGACPPLPAHRWLRPPHNPRGHPTNHQHRRRGDARVALGGALPPRKHPECEIAVEAGLKPASTNAEKHYT